MEQDTAAASSSTSTSAGDMRDGGDKSGAAATGEASIEYEIKLLTTENKSSVSSSIPLKEKLLLAQSVTIPALGHGTNNSNPNHKPLVDGASGSRGNKQLLRGEHRGREGGVAAATGNPTSSSTLISSYNNNNNNINRSGTTRDIKGVGVTGVRDSSTLNNINNSESNAFRNEKENASKDKDKDKKKRNMCSISLDKLPSLAQRDSRHVPSVSAVRERLMATTVPGGDSDVAGQHTTSMSNMSSNNTNTNTNTNTNAATTTTIVSRRRARALLASSASSSNDPGIGVPHALECTNNNNNNSSNHSNNNNQSSSIMPKIEMPRKERGSSDDSNSSNSSDKDKGPIPHIFRSNPNYNIPGFTKYLYYLKNMGNNTQVLKSALQRRPWWQEYKPVFSLSEGRKKEGGGEEKEGGGGDLRASSSNATAISETAQTPQFLFEQYRNHHRYLDDTYVDVILNHIENNHCLVSKKGLYYSVQGYCDANGIDPTTIIPLTFYLTNKDNSGDDRESFYKYNNCPLPVTAATAAVTSDTSTSAPASTAASTNGNNNGSGATKTDEGSEKKDDHASLNSEKRMEKEKSKPEASRANKGSGGGSYSQAALLAAAASREEADLQGSQGIWILKPASRTNRGFGIKVVKGVAEVMQTVLGGNYKGSGGGGGEAQPPGTDKFHVPIKGVGWDMMDDSKESGPDSRHFWHKNADRMAEKNGWIVQQYMSDPLLVSGRKFDIRCYCLLTLNGKELSAYFFRDMYVRTSSKKYSLLKLSDREAHLTNDAVQKNSKLYGKFENGNKMTMDELQNSISRDYPGASPTIVRESIIPAIKRLTYLSVLSGAQTLSSSKINRSFEILGYDYMIDAKFKPYLIEINSNPCLEFVSPYLEELITSMVNGAVTVSIDPYYPPPSIKTKFLNETIADLAKDENRWELIYPTYPGV